MRRNTVAASAGNGICTCGERGRGDHERWCEYVVQFPEFSPALTAGSERQRTLTKRELKIEQKYQVTPQAIERLTRDLIRSRAAAFRSINPIIGYAGHNGSGKTLAMVWDAQHVMLTEGRVQLSTVPLFDYTKPPVYEERRSKRTGKVSVVQVGPLHPLYEPLEDWMQLVRAEECDILLDEVQGVASSRGMNSLPPQLLSKFLQLRRSDCRLRWTTTNWTRVDKALREVTYVLALCQSQRPDRHRGAGPWTPRLKFKVRLIDSTGLDSIDTIDPTRGRNEDGEKLQTFQIERRKRRRNEPAMYNTMGHTTVMNHMSDGGWCITCGGTRQRPKCSCGKGHE